MKRGSVMDFPPCIAVDWVSLVYIELALMPKPSEHKTV